MGVYSSTPSCLFFVVNRRRETERSRSGRTADPRQRFLCLDTGRPVSLVQFSQVQRHIMMSLHLPTAQPTDAHLDSCTVICVWNIWEPSRPQKVLVYESEVSSHKREEEEEEEEVMMMMGGGSGNQRCFPAPITLSL